VVGAKYRACCNELSDSEREKLNDEFLKLYCADSPASPLVAVDANIVMNLGNESEAVLDALATIRQGLRSLRMACTRANAP
jgi:hypothetical protein